MSDVIFLFNLTVLTFSSDLIGPFYIMKLLPSSNLIGLLYLIFLPSLINPIVQVEFIVQPSYRNIIGLLTQVIILEGGWYCIGIGLVGFIFKVCTLIMNNRLRAAINFHYAL